MTDHPSPPPRRARFARWSGATPPPTVSHRWLFRLIGIPALAVAGVLIYRGLHDRFVLPQCDSSRAKNTLAEVLKQLEVAPLGNEPIRTISSSKDKVACNVVLPLSDGGTLNIDYTFFWQGSGTQMRYSIERKPARSSALDRPAALLPARPGDPASVSERPSVRGALLRAVTVNQDFVGGR